MRLMTKRTSIQFSKINSQTLALLTFGLTTLMSSSLAQPSTQLNAFTTCMDANEKLSLCSVTGWHMAEGFSAEERSSLASLRNRFFTAESALEACDDSSIPASLEISLVNASLVIGDKLNFEDILVEAFDENGDFLPAAPVIVSALAQDGMLSAHPDWEYVEVSSYGYATLMVHSYCKQSPQAGASITFSVAP